MKFVIVLLFAAVMLVAADPADEIVDTPLADEMPGALNDEYLDGIAYDEIIEVPAGQPLPKGAVPLVQSPAEPLNPKLAASA